MTHRAYHINFKTIGHQTADNRGVKEDMETNGPILAESSEENERFLGTGYYFWDNSMALGHFWGRVHYHRKYRIYSGDITLSDKDNKLLDLVGRREHQINFLKLKKLIVKLDPSRANWGIGKIIELLKELELTEEHRGIFNYAASRAFEIANKPRGGMKFVSHMNKMTDLKPRIVICLYFYKSGMLDNFKCVHSVDINN